MLPLSWTAVALEKPVPVSVTVSPPLPVTADAGVTPARTGLGLSTSRVPEFCTERTPLSLAMTARTPPVGNCADVTVAVSWVELT